MNHLTQQQLASFLIDACEVQTKLDIEEHLESCEDCLEQLKQLTEIDDPKFGDETTLEFDDIGSKLISQISDIVRNGIQDELGHQVELNTELTFKRQIGSGGFGKVYECQESQFNRGFAVKTLKENLAHIPAIRERFRREMKLTAAVDHAGSPTVYGKGQTDGGRDFLLMQLVDGPSLSQLIQKFHESKDSMVARSDRQFRQLLEYFREICETVHAAHRKNIIHRDLKPDNIRIDGNGAPIVLDWGLAKELAQETDSHERDATDDPTLTSFGRQIGTPLYMPPEQAAGESATVCYSSDIYGLGAILFEILVGRPPHEDLSDIAGSCSELLDLVATRDCPDLPGVPPELKSICQQTLEVDPSKRHNTPLEIAGEVENWLAGQKVPSHNYSLSQYVSLKIRNQPMAFAIGTFSLISFLLLTLAIAQLTMFASEQQSIATNRFESALEAYVFMVEEIQAQLSKNGETVESRKKLIGHAVNGIQGLIENASDKNESGLAMAKAHLVLANILKTEERDLQGAIKEYELSLAVLDRCQTKFQETLTWNLLQCEANEERARAILDLNGIAASKEAFSDFKVATEKFQSRFQTSDEARIYSARVLLHEGLVAAKETGDFDFCEDKLNKGLTLTEGLSPNRATRKIQVGLQEELAKIEFRRRDYKKAAKLQTDVVREIKSMREKLDDFSNRMWYSKALMNESTFLSRGGQIKDAENQLMLALETAEQLVTDFPKNLSCQKQVLEIRQSLGAIYRKTDRDDEALMMLQNVLMNENLKRKELDLELKESYVLTLASLLKLYEKRHDSVKCLETAEAMVTARCEMHERDPANHENLNELLATLQAVGDISLGAQTNVAESAELLSQVCSRLDQDSLADRWNEKLRIGMGRVYYYLGNLQLNNHGGNLEGLPDRKNAKVSFYRSLQLLSSSNSNLSGPISELRKLIKLCGDN